MFKESEGVVEPLFDVEAYLAEITASVSKPCSLAQSITDAVNARLRDEFMEHLFDRLDQKPVDTSALYIRGDGRWTTAYNINDDTLGTGLPASFYCPYTPLDASVQRSSIAEILTTLQKNERQDSFSSGPSKAALEFIIRHTTEEVITQLHPLMGIQPAVAPMTAVFHMSSHEANNMVQLYSKVFEAKSRRLECVQSEMLYENFGVPHILLDVCNSITANLISDAIKNLVDPDYMGLSKMVTISRGQENDEINKKILRNAIVSSSNSIALNTRVAKGNVVICHPNTADILCGQENVRKTRKMIEMVGTLFGNIDVYSTETLMENEIVVGYRGNRESDVGFMYVPLTVVTSSGVVLNPNTYQPTVSFMTRGSMKMLDHRYYEKIEIEFK